MTKRYELSRRKVLAGLGTIGLASAGAGLGTTAYFSDEETYENNTLTAGELDLLVDWEEHYYDDASDHDDDRTDDVGGDEFDEDLDGDGVDDFEIVRTNGDPNAVPEEYVGFPTFDEPVVAVPDAAMDDFLDNTAIEAVPDENDDGIQDPIMTRNQISTQNPTLSPEEVEEAFRDQFANVPDDLERPVIELEDVKPGDFGEMTFSTHLFNNPGYLWLTGDLLEASENGLTEPERKDPDEDQTLDGDGTVVPKDGVEEPVVELLDEIQVAVWYDDGDNVREAEEMIDSPHDVDDNTNITLEGEQSLIARGTLREVLSDLSTPPGIELDADPRSAERNCYPNSTDYYFGFAWWLPVDHANEIQTDSVTFDLGFYTEQCRHNDGSGMAAEVVDTVEMTDGFGTNSGTVYSLTDDEGAGYPENMVTTVRSDGEVVFELDLPKPLDDANGDNWSLTIDADDDGTADFQVVYNDGFSYQEFDGSWGSASMPPGIDTSIEDSGGTYVIRIPSSMLSGTFSFGGQLRYNGETPNNPGENFVVNLVPGFAWGSGFNGDASSYYTVMTS